MTSLETFPNLLMKVVGSSNSSYVNSRSATSLTRNLKGLCLANIVFWWVGDVDDLVGDAKSMSCEYSDGGGMI